jgi:hypothetical protein
VKLTMFERAILDHVGRQHPDIQGALAGLSVVRRTQTPCGCYTNFEETASDVPSTRQLGIDFITVPGVNHGMCAILDLRESQPTILELVTFGGEGWDGVFDGFKIEDAV